GPPGTGKTHLSIALGVQAARRGHRVAFASAQDWVSRLAGAKRAGKLEEELERLRRIPLVIVDEVGYTPLRPRRRRPVLLVDLEPLRAGQPDRQLQQELLGMGRDLWRRHRRRGPGRPPGAPRRGRRPAGRELPAQRPSQGGDAQELTLTAQISTGDSRADFDRRRHTAAGVGRPCPEAYGFRGRARQGPVDLLPDLLPDGPASGTSRQQVAPCRQ